MATTFKRVKSERKATFAPFDPCFHEVTKAAKGRKSEYINTRGADGKAHLMLLGELSALQDDNALIKILVNNANEIAQEGEECTLATDVPIGRDGDGVLVVI